MSAWNIVGEKGTHTELLENIILEAPGTGVLLFAGYQPYRSATFVRESGRACCIAPLVINRLSRTIQSDHKDAKQ